MNFKITVIVLFVVAFSFMGYTQKESEFGQVEQLIENKVPRGEMSITKGWKYEHRWLDEFKKRVAPDGSFYDGAIFYKEAERVAALKSQSIGRMAGWIPVGPTERANSSLTKGLGRINCITFHPTDSNIFWVGVAQGGVWRTNNHGETWTPLTDDTPITRISDIAIDPNHPDTMYISLGDYAYIDVSLSLDDRDRHSHYGIGVYKSTDGGSSWAPTGLTYQLEELDGSLMRRVIVNPASPNNLVAAGVGGIWSSQDGGDNWEQEVDSMIWDIEVDPNDPLTLFATTGYLKNIQAGVAGIIKSTDFGDTWTWLNTGIPTTVDVLRIEVAVAPSNSDHVYALCCNSDKGLYGIYSSLDGGVNWTQVNNGGTNILEWYEGTGSGGQGTYDLSLLIDPNDDDKIYTGGVNVWTSDDGGVTFDGVSVWYQTLHADQHQFKHNPLDKKFYICNDGGLMRTDSILSGSWANSYWPTDWEYVSDGMQTNSFYRVAISEGNSGNFSAGAQDNSTYYNNASNWSNLFGGDGMETMLHPSDPNIIFGSSQYGYISYSSNGGANTNGMSGPGEDSEWTTPFMYKPGSTDLVYGGFGNLYSATPGGSFNTSMSNFSNMPGSGSTAPISQFNVAQSDPDYIYVAKRIYHSYNQQSELWMTSDNGSNWSNITAGLNDSLYFNWIEIDNDDPLTAWVVVAGFEVDEHVYQTTDGGVNWNNVTYDLPNLPTNCIVHHDSSYYNTVYVGTDIGVYYSNDTLQSWMPLNDNLPNVIVSDLDIHYADQKIYAATFGRGVWMTDLLTTELIQLDTTTTFDTTTSSINEMMLLANATIDLYPNPNSGKFGLDIQGFAGNELEIEIIDIMGKVVANQKLIVINGKVFASINYGLPSGMYFVKISHNKRMRSIRFIVR